MLTTANTQTLPAFPRPIQITLQDIIYCQTTVQELETQRQLLLQQAPPVPQTPPMTLSLLGGIATLCEHYTKAIDSKVAELRSDASSFLALHNVHLNTPYTATIPSFYSPQTDPNEVSPQTLEITGFSICQTPAGPALYLRLRSGTTDLPDTLPTELTIWR